MTIDFAYPTQRFALRLMPVAAFALLLTACELAEIVVAFPTDIVVAEVILRADAPVQTAYLHRTTSELGSARVFDARVKVREQGTGREIVFQAEEDSLCISSAVTPPPPSIGTCYVARGQRDMVRAGGVYALEITLADGDRLTGITTVPGAFEIVRPALAECSLAAMTSLELMWTRSAGAWVYIGETRIPGLIEALGLADPSIPPGQDAVELLGLSIGGADTTLVFPGEFGLFDRFDDELVPVLLAIRDGLPAGLDAEIVVLAADRNYVNWVRGGTFNPSGTVRLPSVAGGGTGVFGSMVIRRLNASTAVPAGFGSCSGND
ncbi:hypothetical protein BH23GEM9_BH23GEM9_33680 [soil metagenome]